MPHRTLYRFLARFLANHDRRKIATKILTADSFDFSIRNATNTNSRSILYACNIHPNNPKSSDANSAYLDEIPELAKKLYSTDKTDIISIYIPSDGITYFANKVLQKIDKPFVLVSGDSDLPVNRNICGSSLEILLGSPLLVKWLAQNRDYDHPKLHSLPIGINIHNLWGNPLQWGGGFILPALQELQLQSISHNALPLTERINEIFCNWHFSIDRADRKQCYEEIDRSVCYFQPDPLPVDKTWLEQSRYQFVLSPHGAGLDCHRTWEALLLGCIPIVKKAKLNDLFKDLPVIEVEDWKQINRAFLDVELQRVLNKPISTEKLYMRYWKNQLK